jgi:hypothetical protein
LSYELTIETVLEAASGPELGAFGGFSREQGVQGKAEKVVGKVSKDGVPRD